METRQSEPAFEECEEGVCLVISPTARLGMKGESPAASVTAEEGRDPCYPSPAAVYHLTLTAAPKQCGHLVGRYQATVSRNSLHLVSEGTGKRWCWQLEHIRRFSVQEKDSRLVIETGRCIYVPHTQSEGRAGAPSWVDFPVPTAPPQEGRHWRGTICLLWGQAPPALSCPEGADWPPLCGHASQEDCAADTRKDCPAAEDCSTA